MPRLTLRRKLVLGALALVAAACDNAGTSLGFPSLATGGVVVQFVLDRDGSNSLTSNDTLIVGARVSLTPPGGGKAIKTATSGTTGNAVFENLVIADYGILIEPSTLGDSLVIENVNPTVVRLVAAASPPVVNVRLGYPEASTRKIRQLPLGRRVVTRGLILAGVQSFRDTTSHVKDTAGAIRLTRVTIRNGSGNNPGDSVTAVGRVSSRAGQPTLDQAVITTFAQRPAPTAVLLSSAVAATAQGGALDAALVQLTGVIISQSGPQGPDFRIVASDGSGPITIILDGTLPADPAAFPVGRTMNARGVLVPDGNGKWQLKPRNGNDIVLF